MFINVRMSTQPSLCVWEPRTRQLWGIWFCFPPSFLFLTLCILHSPWPELQSNPPVSTSGLDVGVNRIIDNSHQDTTSSSLQVLGSKLKPRSLHCTHFLPAEPSHQSKFYFLKQYSSYTSSGTQSNFPNFYFLKIYRVKSKWLRLEWHDHGWSRGAQFLQDYLMSKLEDPAANWVSPFRPSVTFRSLQRFSGWITFILLLYFEIHEICLQGTTWSLASVFMSCNKWSGSAYQLKRNREDPL